MSVHRSCVGALLVQMCGSRSWWARGYQTARRGQLRTSHSLGRSKGLPRRSNTPPRLRLGGACFGLGRLPSSISSSLSSGGGAPAASRRCPWQQHRPRARGALTSHIAARSARDAHIAARSAALTSRRGAHTALTSHIAARSAASASGSCASLCSLSSLVHGLNAGATAESDERSSSRPPCV